MSDRPLIEGITPAGRVSSRPHFVLETTDVDVARDTLFRTFLPHDFEPITARNFRFRHQKLSLDTVSFNDISYGTESHVAAPKLDAFYCVQLSLKGTCRIEQMGERIPVPPNSIYVIDPRYTLRQVHPSGYRQMNIRINRGLLDDFILHESGACPKIPVEFVRRAFPANGVAAPLARFIRYVCEAGVRSEARNELTARCAEKSLLAILLTTLPNNYQDKLKSEGAQGPAAIIRAEEFIADHASEPINVIDISAAARVSIRTLYYLFEKYRQSTPMAALKQCRLTLARQLLQVGRRQGLNVTDAAYRCGFNHLSKFARDYYQRFGELPSETLNRQRGTIPACGSLETREAE